MLDISMEVLPQTVTSKVILRLLQVHEEGNTPCSKFHFISALAWSVLKKAYINHQLYRHSAITSTVLISLSAKSLSLTVYLYRERCCSQHYKIGSDDTNHTKGSHFPSPKEPAAG